ncbi:hypothetical protein FQR65_LT14440 [Abscondita terminalis]|nr:hypothetical protein FQR65_LT14440 [Abscondita terminalis]
MHSKDEHLPVLEGRLFEDSYDDSTINLSMESSVKNIFDIDVFSTPNARGIYEEELPWCEADKQTFSDSEDDESVIEVISISSEENYEEEAPNMVCEDTAAGEMEFDEELPERIIELIVFRNHSVNKGKQRLASLGLIAFSNYTIAVYFRPPVVLDLVYVGLIVFRNHSVNKGKQRLASLGLIAFSNYTIAVYFRPPVVLDLVMFRRKKLMLPDPKVMKKTIWKEIAQAMCKNNFPANDSMVERKFRNMKNTHKAIKDNKHKKSTGGGQVTWEYADDKTINVGHTIASLPSNITELNLSVPSSSTITTQSCAPVPSLPSTSTQSTSYTEISDSTPLTPVQEALPIPMSSSMPLKKEKAKRGQQLYGLRKKQLEIEEKRLQEIKELKEAINKNNKIQKERNELFAQFLEYLQKK